MELHHKLRRDPNWHPNACNICGGMGHQAANCKTGTIKWREVFGNEAFIVRKPVFMTDILKKREERQVDHAKLEADAIAYAKRQCEASGMSYSIVEQVAAKSQSIDCEALLKEKAAQLEAEEMKHKRRKENVAAAAPAAAAPEAELPPGWAIAHDAKGKPYYWHTATMKVQWDKPTAATPIN